MRVVRSSLAVATLVMVSAAPALAQNFQPPVTLDTSSPPKVYGGPATATTAMTTTIVRQVQPCADRQVIPAPAAMEIVLVVKLDLNPDGSLADFRILDRQGITDTNRAYLPHVEKAVETIFTECTPIQGLPPELYDVPRGWKSIKFIYRMKN